MQIRDRLVSVIATVLLAGCSESATRVDTEIDPAPEIAAHFQAEIDRLHAAAKETDENFPGATAAFILPDGRIYGFATGSSDVMQNIPMGKDLRMPRFQLYRYRLHSRWNRYAGSKRPNVLRPVERVFPGPVGLYLHPAG